MGIFQIIEWLLKFFSFAVHVIEVLLVLIIVGGTYYIVRTERKKLRKRSAGRRRWNQ